MTPIKRKLLYIFRGTLLRLRISWDHGKTLTLSVGYHVDRTDAKGKPKWDGSRCVRNTTHGEDKVPAATINKVLEQLEDKIDKAFLVFENNDKIPDQKMLKNEIDPDKNSCEKKSLGELIVQYREEQSVLCQWSYNTAKLVKQALANLTEVFGEKSTLNVIDDAGMVRLMNHMTSKECFDFKRGTEEVTTHKGYNNETINRYMMFIRSFVKWAEEKGHIKDCPLGSATKQLKTAKSPVIYLTLEEIEKFRAVEVTPASQEVKDCFIFCCFTGIRYSDLKTMRWGQVKSNHIEIVTQKTNDLLKIELNKFSKAILDKRQRGKDDENVFKVICNSDYNKIVKDIAKKAGLNEPVEIVSYIGKERKVTRLPKWNFITSHIPRKTFVTNALSLGVPPAIVMKWTGHKSIKAMAPYMEIVSKAKEQNMDLFNRVYEALNFVPNKAK